ncbi:TonB-dependent siderophore receptor [Scytonema sp. HK-05]|uniref:TonB-dependent siderophore receptor n=1 Tax=Scytonema sp. HK-05 TaxID=1137095 RepID=UPI000936287E|nr:TonB-dependent siderophore receptor [Scytonema sp. HK-05]OKH54657.1 ferrichrome-iron receptor [Scytonema sp. HK-05]BAY48990.1 TonB-dependent siderophore receptor [Scytonema sp. HK-05]
MKRKQLLPSLLLTGSAIVLITTPARTHEVQVLDKKAEHALTDKGVSFHQGLPRKIEGPFAPTKEIRRLSEIERPITSAQKLVQSPAPTTPPATEVVQVTTVKANPTNQGVEVILQTSKGQQLQVTNRSSGNSFIVDIPNAQLRSPSGDAFIFRSTKPIAGITEITVTNQDANTIRVTVTGEAGVPKVELFDSPEEGLIFGVTSVASSTPQAQQPQTQQKPEAADQPATQTQPGKPSAQSDEAIELLVTGEQDGYSVPDATTATRTDTPLRDIPQSIQVVPQKVLQDQQIVRIGEAARNVSGVTRTIGYGGSVDNYRIRGFSPNFTLKDGFRQDNFITFTESANIERVEILKGPASVLYGQLEPGGIVNYVTKQPLSEPSYGGQLTIGSYDFYRPTLDISGPLNPDRSALYRLNLAYENAGSFRDFVDNELLFVAPVLSYRLGENTNLTLQGEYLDFEKTFDRGFLPESPFFRLPRSRFLGDPGDSQEINTARLSYILEHRFSKNWSLRNAFALQSTDSRRRNAEPNSLLDDRTLTRSFRRVDDYTQDYILQTDFIGKFNTGSIAHQLLLGVELNRNKYDYRFRIASDFPNIDIFNPVYDALIPSSFDSDDYTDTTTDNVGIYFQDLVSLLPNLKLLAGGRFDIVDYDSEFIADFPNNSPPEKDSRYYEAFSPRIGLVYQPIEPVSLYFSYTRSFKPNFTALTVNREPLEPERGTQYEVGIKTELLDNRLSATVAAYEITKSNVATTDPNNRDFYVAAGEVKSRGIELDIAGQLAPGWNIIASYGFNEAFVSKDNNPASRGNQLQNAPTHTASLWTTYQLQSGSLKGLGFGAGIFFVGEREATLPNSIKIPSYVRTDATVFYQQNNWRAALNFKNLFDIKYYDSQNFSIYPGAPLTILGTISVQF